MYQAERGLFELRRQRPLLVVSEPWESAEPTAIRANGGDPLPGVPPASCLVASVEGLEGGALELLREVGGSPLSLVITGHRARALGLEVPGASSVTVAVPEGFSLQGISLVAAGIASPGNFGHDFGGRASTPCEEAGLTLARLAHLVPAVLSAEVHPEGGARLMELLRQGVISMVETQAVGALAAPPLDLVQVSQAPVPLANAEHARFILFREPRTFVEHVAVVMGSQASWPDPVPVRLHSACLTGDIFGSLRCDCGEQLRGSLEHFTAQGGGILLYLAQEGRSIGLANKLRAYSIQEAGLDTVDADCTLGFGPDERSYEAAVAMLRTLRAERIELLTNNPEKVRAMTEAGIRVVDRKPLHGTLTRHNLPYVQAKVDRAGHWLEGMLSERLPDG